MHMDEGILREDDVENNSPLSDMLEDFKVPILMDLDIGHLPPMMPLVEGSLARVDRKGNSIEIRMDFS